MSFEQTLTAAVEHNDLSALAKLETELFAEDGAGAFPFAPSITLTARGRDALDLEEAGPARGLPGDTLRTIAMRVANRIEKAKRLIRFRLSRNAHPNATVIVSEGDSWFQYPVFLKDVIDHLSDDDDKAFLSFGDAGDLLSTMARRREYFRAINRPDACLFMLSGGGNDLFGNGAFENVLRPFEDGRGAVELLDADAYGHLMRRVQADYRRVLQDVWATRPDIAVLGHAYDVPIPRPDGQWIREPLRNKGIPDVVGVEIVTRILDDFALFLAQLDAEYENFGFVNLKGAVGQSPNSWHDEIHPKNAGFSRIAERFRDAIDAHLPLATSAAAVQTLALTAQQPAAPPNGSNGSNGPGHGSNGAGKHSNATRILNCRASEEQEADWSVDDARAAGILRTSRRPDRVDLREPWWTIGDQGSTGSCVGWATADSVLRWHFVKKGRMRQDERLSVRFTWVAAKETDAFSERPTSFIEDAGTSLKAALDVARRLGCVTEGMLPFDRDEVFFGSENAFYASAARFKINSYHNLRCEPSDWRAWLHEQGPILTRLNVDQAFVDAAKTSARLTGYDDSAKGGHAIALVGYTPEGFIVRNSWSQTWGDRGYALATDAYAEAAFAEAYGVIVN